MIDIILPYKPGWNKKEYLIKAVESIYENTNEFRLIIIIDGGKESDLPFEIKENMIVVSWPENKGLPIASNCGLRLAKSEFVARLMDDTEILTKDWDIKFDKTVDHINVAPTSDSEQHGSFLIFKRSLLNEVGYLSQDFGKWGYDDIEYRNRITSLGYKFIHQKGIEFNHLGDKYNEELKEELRRKNNSKFTTNHKSSFNYKWGVLKWKN